MPDDVALLPYSAEEQRSIDAAALQRELAQPELLAAAVELREAAYVLARRRAHLSSDRPMRFVSVLYGLDPETSERIATGIESGELNSEPDHASPDEWRETARVQRALLALADRLCALPNGEQPVVDPDAPDLPF